MVLKHLQYLFFFSTVGSVGLVIVYEYEGFGPWVMAPGSCVQDVIISVGQRRDACEWAMMTTTMRLDERDNPTINKLWWTL